MSNAVSLGQNDIRTMLRGPCVAGALPLSNDGMRFFLHEFTHHATFAGPVGQAMSALATSVAGRACIGAFPDGEEGLWLQERDDLVLRCFATLIEPLVEGLALFAEHDVHWGPFEFASHALIHLWACFLFGEGATAIQAAIERNSKETDVLGRIDTIQGDIINARLRRARASEYWIGQKARLFKQPLLGSKSQPAYLLGYLATKRAHLRIGNRPRSDSDSFLLLMQDYWFHDEFTARCLVELNDRDIMTVQATIGALLDHFQDLWDELYKFPRKAGLKLLERLTNKNGEQERPVFGPFQLHVGMRTAADSLNAFVPRFHKHRLILRLGFLRVNIVIAPNSEAAEVFDLEEGVRLFECPTVPLADRGTFPGTVEIVRTYDGSVTAVLVLGGSGLVAVRDLFGTLWNDRKLIERFDDFPSIEFVEAAAMSYQESAFAKNWNEGKLAPMNDHVMEQISLARNGTYLQIAFPGADERQRESILERLRERGLAALCTTDAELIDMATLSLMFGGDGAKIQDIGEYLKRSAKEIETTLRSINEKSLDALGATFFELGDGRAISAI